MRYLIIIDGQAFLTNWYDYENHYVKGMIVINTNNFTITFDGITWKEIEEDSL